MPLASSTTMDCNRNPVEIAERVWWVGHVQVDDPFQCHVYLIEQGEQSVLVDPGSRLTFRHTLRKIEQIIPFSAVRYFICHHQDPDIIGALPIIDELVSRDDAVLVTHWRARALIKHYDPKLPFWLVDEHDWKLRLDDRVLSFIFTPYAHFPGAFCTFDHRSGVLFSSDIFGGFTEEFSLFAQDERYFEAMRPFHEHYMPSRDILAYAIAKIEEYPVRIIAPQHGSIIPTALVRFMIDKLKHLDCGIYLMARESSDIQRLIKLNQALRDIIQTMVISRDFQGIASNLLAIVQRLLPVCSMEFYACLEDGTLLHLAPETRYRGVVIVAPPFVADLISKTRQEWASTQQRAYDYRVQSTAEGRTTAAILLPLFSPDHDTIQALAVIHLQTEIPASNDIDQLIEQATLPLQVAVEREVIYRTLDLERQRFYERSIRDSLTGLFTRFYMHDTIQRLFDIHDRDANATVAVAIMDVDHFKSINDTFGHTCGDIVLQQVAAVLLDNVRSSDLPIRLGGEEFALFVMGQSLGNTCLLAERIRRQVTALSFAAPMTSWKITLSVGLALRRQQESLTDFIQRADVALYAAKRAGRDRVQVAS